jgi:hypothetical protein
VFESALSIFNLTDANIKVQPKVCFHGEQAKDIDGRLNYTSIKVHKYM